MTAKLLFLAKITRPDILVAVSYLTTRVKEPTIADQKKLQRVINYVKSTSSKKMIFKGHGEEVEAFIDASFNVHTDAMGHSGLLIKVFGDTVKCKSKKQTSTTSDSTEAELVALTTRAPEVAAMEQFMRDMGYHVKIPTIWQDNKSCITIAETGHLNNFHPPMRVKAAMMKEMIDSRLVELKYCKTNFMQADVLTKSLQGPIFKKMASEIVGETHTTRVR